MFKMAIDDFLTEIKEEIMSYEELGEEAAQKWETRFLKWLKDDKIKKSSIKKEKDRTYFVMKDESDLFSIVDNYWAAIENNEEALYWEKFS